MDNKYLSVLRNPWKAIHNPRIVLYGSIWLQIFLYVGLILHVLVAIGGALIAAREIVDLFIAIGMDAPFLSEAIN